MENTSSYRFIQSSVKDMEFHKGQFISPEEVERFSLISRDNRIFGLSLLNLKTIIQNWFLDRGVTVTIKTEIDGLRILTDEEATVYNHEMFRNRIRSLLIINDRTQGVVTSEMSEEQRKNHDNRLIAQGRFIQGILSINEKVPLIPYKRPK